MYVQNSQNSSKLLNIYMDKSLLGIIDLRLIATFLFGSLTAGESNSGSTLVIVNTKLPF